MCTCFDVPVRTRPTSDLYSDREMERNESDERREIVSKNEREREWGKKAVVIFISFLLSSLEEGVREG